MLSFPCVCQAPASTRFPSRAQQRDSGFLYLCRTSLFSNACAVLSTTGNTHLLSLQSLPPSFHHDGGYTPLFPFWNSSPRRASAFLFNYLRGTHFATLLF